jgi:hypothetical protein
VLHPVSVRRRLPNRGRGFRVLLIAAEKNWSQLNLHTFGAGVASWSAPVMCFHMMERQVWSMEQTKAAIGGRAHWLFVSMSNHFHILNVDIETGQVSLARLQLVPEKERFLIDNLVEVVTSREKIRRALTFQVSTVLPPHQTAVFISTVRNYKL